jgi:hypothetical protein
MIISYKLFESNVKFKKNTKKKNAKTDTFTEQEFLDIGRVIKSIWERRIGRNI